MLRIGICCYPSLGGSGVVATELGKMMAERGHQVHMISYGMPFRLGKFYRNIFYHEVEVNDYYVFKYPPYDLSLASKMAQVAQAQQLDLLHVHYAIPFAVSAWLAKQMIGDRLKIVTTLHGTDITILGQDPSMRDLIKLAIDRSDAVSAVSDDLIQATRSVFGTKRPIQRIYNFIDQRYYFPRVNLALRREFAADDEAILMHVSNYRPLKRTHEVLDVFERVRNEHRVKLIFVGEGPELPRLMDQVRDRGWQEDVLFIGKQDDVSEVIALADVLLLPSEKESFGLVALEAMACGVPVVASCVGGIPEVVRHGETGFLSELGDVESMASYCSTLITDRAQHAQFAANAVSRARNEFSAERIAETYEQLYQSVISGDWQI
jgi:N-acetyl-alpha-D-glucosaminyl L-malate synthase BshA